MKRRPRNATRSQRKRSTPPGSEDALGQLERELAMLTPGAPGACERLGELVETMLGLMNEERAALGLAPYPNPLDGEDEGGKEGRPRMTPPRGARARA